MKNWKRRRKIMQSVVKARKNGIKMKNYGA